MWVWYKKFVSLLDGDAKHMLQARDGHQLAILFLAGAMAKIDFDVDRRIGIEGCNAPTLTCP